MAATRMATTGWPAFRFNLSKIMNTEDREKVKGVEDKLLKNVYLATDITRMQ